MRAMILTTALLMPLCACDQPQGPGSSSQQGTVTTMQPGDGASASRPVTEQQPKEAPRIGPRGEHMAGSQPQRPTGSVPNDASSPMAAPNSLNSGGSDGQVKDPGAAQQQRTVGTSRPTPFGTDPN